MRCGFHRPGAVMDQRSASSSQSQPNKPEACKHGRGRRWNNHKQRRETFGEKCGHLIVGQCHVINLELVQVDLEERSAVGVAGGVSTNPRRVGVVCGQRGGDNLHILEHAVDVELLGSCRCYVVESDDGYNDR